jgi:putative ABC transport system permease protein
MKQGNPPRWAVKFFRWFCNDHLSDAVLGDLLEMYDRQRARVGKFKADLVFVWSVIQFIQPFAIRKQKHSSPINTFGMIQNYYKVARRNMSKNKMHTGITIGGFALGIATCMVIFLFMRNELSYDKHYKDGSRIFRIYNDYTGPGPDQWTSIQPAFAGVIRQELPDIELTGRLMANGMGDARSGLVRREDEVENRFEEKIAYIDPEMLDILEIPMAFGDTKKALKDPLTLVISRSKSKEYFGDTNPIGKTMVFNENKSNIYTVGGVFEDFRTESYLQFNFLLTLSGKEFWPGEQTNWCCWNYTTYVKLREGVNPDEFEKKLVAIRDQYLLSYMEQTGSQDVEDVRLYHFYRLQSVGDVWLQPDIGDPNKHGSMTYVWLFGSIAVFILILACINFINLSTARSANRAKEVGLRKVVGSMRKYLVAQFLTESVVYSLISFAIAVILATVMLPAFSSVSGRSLTMPWSTWWFFPVLAAASLFIGLLAGLYPALYLSAFKPIDVLKGNLSRGSRSSSLRSGMVVFQFATSIILIISTFIVYRQMNFLMNREVGFDKEQVMILEGTGTLGEQREAFRAELQQLPSVESVSISSYLPIGGMSREGYGFFLEGREKQDKAVSCQKWRVDFEYVKTLKMRLLEGRDFNRDLASDSQAAIINQTAALQLGLKDPIGKRITNGTVYTVIGVVADFNYASMKEPVRPVFMVIEGGGESAISIRLNSTDVSVAIQSVNELWNKFMPNQPIRFSFLDEKFARMYDDVRRMGLIFTTFAVLAIVVACLGLFALSAFMIEQRSKEISIRLVMGAPVKSIFSLLTSNFMKLVLLSFVIAAPLAWFGMDKWLQGYTYRTPISSDIFIISGLIALSIALATVSYQSIKAAVTKPVDNLRRE